MAEALLRPDLVVTCLVSAISFVAVWLPFQRGLRLCAAARSATRTVGGEELRRSLTGRGFEREEPLAVLLARVIGKSLRERSEGAQPSEFLVDASRQYVVGEFETHFARPISMYANLLPPIGFIGTTGGMLILFLSMHLGQTSLEIGALAMALTSSVFALLGFAALEGMKIRLYSRMLGCVGSVLALRRAAEAGGAQA